MRDFGVEDIAAILQGDSFCNGEDLVLPSCFSCLQRISDAVMFLWSLTAIHFAREGTYFHCCCATICVPDMGLVDQEHD